jgi:hypothetical protein
MRLIWKVELLTTQAIRKKLLHTKIHTYLSYFSTKSPLELSHVVLSNKFLYACELYHGFDTFYQLLITVESLWSQPVLMAGKEMVTARSEIRVVRRVVKQLQVDILQQCSSVSCMWTCIAMEEHYPGCQLSMPFVLNGPTVFLVLHNTRWKFVSARWRAE